jgi:hypothetical protein
MGYADLIRTLQSLPQDKQAEVFDFVEFLATRSGIGVPATGKTRPITAFFGQPFRVESFQPLSRDDANAR